MLMMSSQILTSALEFFRDYLWNFTVALTLLQETFVLVMHRFGKLRYFVSDFHIKAPPSPQCSAASTYILERAIFLALALRFVRRREPTGQDDGLLYAKNLLSHSLMHLALVPVLRAIRFPSFIQTGKL